MLPACLFSSFADQSDRNNRSKMAANVRTDMRIPTRVAPRPPPASLMNQRNNWNNSNDLLSGSLNPHPPQKKKPPPRPPPPKFLPSRNQNDRSDKSKKPQRPAELLTNLFNRKPAKNMSPVSYSYSNAAIRQSGSNASSTASNRTVCLIDLSPPRSPTFTTRSNSDGVSVDSFGSDGNSNPSMFTSSGNTSQTESAFEDDFDFFASLPNNKSGDNDPWKTNTNPDPFSPLANNSNTPNNNAFFSKSVRTFGNSTFVSFEDDHFRETNDVSSELPSINRTMPTIIRAKPAKPPAPKLLQSSLAPTVTQFHPKPIPKQRNIVPYNEPVTLDFTDAWGSSHDELSPPMPSIPPPAPPPRYLVEMDDQINDVTKPYGIALYDFPATQSNDLPLKEGDTVTLVKVLNSEWLEGRIGNRQGIFPASFIDIKVPLPGLSVNVVNALYTFNGETADDLPFQEGAKITVLTKISDDWLYGECDGKKGQFPANYVDRVPTCLS